MQTEKLSGLIAAPFTAFDAQGEVALDAIPKQADLLLSQGVAGAYICGSTGEGVSLSVAERLDIMAAWSAAANGRLKLIAHTGALSLKDIAVLGSEAQRLGYFATSVVPPTCFRPANIAALVAFCRAAAAAAPELPFYYYHTMLSGVALPMPEFLAAADGVIPNLAGIKFTNFNLYEFQLCRRALDGRRDIVFGVDEIFAAALTLGAEAFIGSTYNFAAGIYQRIWQAWRAGDQATVQRGMWKACRIVEILRRFGGIAAGKAMMSAHGIECGSPRLPLMPLNAGERETIVKEFRAILEEKM